MPRLNMMMDDGGGDTAKPLSDAQINLLVEGFSAIANAQTVLNNPKATKSQKTAAKNALVQSQKNTSSYLTDEFTKIGTKINDINTEIERLTTRKPDPTPVPIPVPTTVTPGGSGSGTPYTPGSGVSSNTLPGYTPFTGSGLNTPAPLTPTANRTLVSQSTKRLTGGVVQVIAKYSDGSTEIVDEYKDFSARDTALNMFRNAGLDNGFINSLMQTIEGVYANSVAPTDAEVLNAINNSDAYKTRFKGNEIIRKRIADGQGRPGDLLLSPKQYIDLENTYRDYMRQAGMPEGFYDSPDDFHNLIGNGISPSELRDRVSVASDALNKADANVLGALRRYYGLSQGDLVAYLLDPERALPVLNTKVSSNKNTFQDLSRIYETAQVGGAAARQGFTTGANETSADRLLAEEIVSQGKSAQAESAFAAAKSIEPDYKRLGALYGDYVDPQDFVRETLQLEGGVEAGRRRRKLASRERATFDGSSAIGQTTLQRRTDL